MVLVDTSVWVAHLRQGDVGLEALLLDGRVACHPCVIGELACGNLRRRSEILALLQALPQAGMAGHGEVMQFIDNHRLMGQGLGYVDMHLLAAALLSRIPLWTLDQKLHEAAVRLGLAA
ncbi:MAG: type II toxin-antitoxin system VapC family toxin [Deltaproteobacteria bacterium]|nr:type II toxin-antitoxin system VapC family toxin [Deltaproteobacteria bacterium]